MVPANNYAFLPRPILGLLGRALPERSAHGRSVAHHLLPCDNLPGLLLPRQPHPRHRRHELRRAPEEGRGGGGECHQGGGGPEGRKKISSFVTIVL